LVVTQKGERGYEAKRKKKNIYTYLDSFEIALDAEKIL
jgi:hypothetical protein